MPRRFRYALEFYKEDGECLGQVPISVDWVPAIEATWLSGLRQRRVEPDDGTAGALIHPLWHGDVGEPYVSGVRVEVPSTIAGGHQADFAMNYFKPQARTASAEFVRRGLLKEGDPYRYLAVAVPDREMEKAGPRPSFKTREITPPLPLERSALADFVGVSRATDAVSKGDIPVFVPERILGETVALSANSGNKEAGGILVGHLHRDAGVPEVFLEVTGQLPARYVQADCHSLTFTAETWTAARAALDLRRRGELFVGWWHSHPLREWCKDCPPQKQSACPLAQGFFSLQDQQVHRTIFPRAYSVALVVNDAADRGVTHSLYGWRDGRLETRPFYVLNRVHSAVPRPARKPEEEAKNAS